MRCGRAQPKFCVGLTGGVGCGKSTVAGMFAALGADIVDTDQIARALTEPGGAAIPAIVAAFGPAALGPDGSLDRPRMRRLVFSDPAERQRLEAILHPLILAEVHRRLASPGSHPYVIVVVPLLVETGAYLDLVDRVLVVDCDEAQQIVRTASRPGMSEAEAQAVMAAQASRAERLARADDVIDNRGDLERLRRQVEALNHRYLEFVKRKKPTGLSRQIIDPKRMNWNQAA